MNKRKILIVIICVIVLLGISMVFVEDRNTTKVTENQGLPKERVQEAEEESAKDDELPSI